jgi:hypothetical protein
MIREMSLDSDRVMPDKKTRHWMLAQTHLVYNDESEQAKFNAYVEDQEYNEPTEVDKARAKSAYDAVSEKVMKKDLNSDSLFEDFISEKAYEFDHFLEQK